MRFPKFKITLPMLMAVTILGAVLWTQVIAPNFNFEYGNIDHFKVTSVRNYELDGKAKIVGTDANNVEMTIMVDDLNEAYDMLRASQYQGVYYNIQYEQWPDGRLRELNSYMVLKP